MKSEFVLKPERLQELADAHRVDYAQAQPFPHIVIDDFLPTEILDQVVAEFPKPEEVDWKSFNNPAEKKLALKDESQMGFVSRSLLHELNSSIFVNFLESLTGIEGLIPDPHFWGGGLHQIKRGGYLKIHADFNLYSRLALDRRLNLLLYLNREWKEEYGGHFELWTKDMTRSEKRVLPVFNRCVIFSTTDFSYHGHPDPLNCPEGQTRKSLALYYYTNGRPSDEVSPLHTTLFQRRPDEGIGASVFSILTRLTPPILVEAQTYLRRVFARKRNRYQR
jgi:Rps23 Pro-64 3,4-dihydroxylase Tpa1-like proline 4-hydroxylase